MLSNLYASILSVGSRKLSYMTYGSRLKQALASAGRDRAALAAELGVSVQAVGQVVTGGRSGTQTFTASNNVKAARFLNVDPHWLATGEGEMVTTNVWPFDLLSPDHVRKLSIKQRAMVEKFALDLLEMAGTETQPTTQVQTAPPKTKGKPLVWRDTVERKRKSGTADTVAHHPGQKRAG